MHNIAGGNRLNSTKHICIKKINNIINKYWITGLPQGSGNQEKSRKTKKMKKGQEKKGQEKSENLTKFKKKLDTGSPTLQSF